MLWLLGLSVHPRKKERKRALQPEDAHHPVVLGATETSCRVGANNERLLTDLTSACAAYPELVVILNVFDSPFPGDLRSLNCGKQTPSTAVPSCVRKVTHVPGMKTAFWRYGISPEVIARVAPHSEIVWLFDNDMRVGAADFDLRDAVASLLAAQVSAAQPRVQLWAQEAFAAVSGANGAQASLGRGLAQPLGKYPSQTLRVPRPVGALARGADSAHPKGRLRKPAQEGAERFGRPRLQPYSVGRVVHLVCHVCARLALAEGLRRSRYGHQHEHRPVQHHREDA